MATIVEMPKLSDTMEEGGIAAWLKKEGEEVSEGEPLVEIETDKATMEYASPDEGILLKILAAEGTSSALRAPIAVLGSKGETVDIDQLVDKTKNPEQKLESSQDVTQKIASPSDFTHESSQGSAQRVRSSPLARKMAHAAGINIADISGSGPLGRVIARDLEHRRQGPQTSPSDQKIPLTQMRKTIAKRLLAGKNEAPHFYLTVSACTEALLEWRRKLNSDPRIVAKELPKVSVNDLLIMTSARALRQHPVLNSSWRGDYILQNGAVNIAFAVALPSGLLTPVVFAADTLGAREIARQTKKLGASARAGELKAEQYQGGTFTISNLGMTRVEEFTAIINPPQAAILAVGTSRALATVKDDGSIVPEQRMKMTLSCDHRVVDGMVGAQFLETLVSYIENPLMILS